MPRRVRGTRKDEQGRVVAEWWPLRWADPLEPGPPRQIRIFDLQELRAVVDTNRAAAGLEPVAWVGRTDNDPTFVARVTPIRAVHFTQLRRAIADLWRVADLGPVPEFAGGPIVAGSRRILLQDPRDLRGWVETYEAARPDLAARVAWRYGVTSRLWPPSPHPLSVGPVVDMWDGVGQSRFWEEAGKPRELRRIDTHWYDVVVEDSEAEPLVTITPDPRVWRNRVTPVPLPATALRLTKHVGVRVLGWNVNWPKDKDDNARERDGRGQVVRLLDGAEETARLAYDGLGRLRKWVDARTWHVLAPSHMIATNDTT